jgi:hypothetical protein
VLRPDAHPARRVELHALPALDIGRDDRGAGRGRAVQQVEIHQLRQAAAERREVVQPGPGCGLRAAGQLRAVESRPAEEQVLQRGAGIVRLPPGALRRRRAEEGPGERRRVARERLPEAAQHLHPPLGRVAGDDRGGDRAGRDANDPVGQHSRLRHRGIGAAFPGAEGDSARHDEGDPAGGEFDLLVHGRRNG